MSTSPSPNVVIQRDDDAVMIRWTNPLPDNVGFAWFILLAIIGVIWTFLLPNAIFETGPMVLFLRLFCIPMGIATLAMLTLALRATFGDRSESITLHGDKLVYSRCNPTSSLFFADSDEFDLQVSPYVGSFAGGVAGAFARGGQQMIPRKHLREVTGRAHHCRLVCDDETIHVGARLSPDDVALIVDAITKWQQES